MSNRDNLKHIYFSLLMHSGTGKRLLANIRARKQLLILNLHQVAPLDNPFWSPMHPDVFDELLKFLRLHFRIGLLRDLGQAGDDSPDLVLSFDDGYYNFVDYAMPILAKHGLKANLNVIPECVETGVPPWNVRLYDFLNSVPRKLINEIRLRGFDHRLADDGIESKVRYGLQIGRFLKNRPRQERLELWDSVCAVMSQAPLQTSTRMMNVADLSEAAAVHEIGVHSYSHESMEFEPEEFFEDDFQRCVDYFEQKLCLPLYIYAFPNGSHREEQITYLKDRGIEKILLVGEQYANGEQEVLPRFTVYGTTPDEAKIRSLGYSARNTPIVRRFARG